MFTPNFFVAVQNQWWTGTAEIFTWQLRLVRTYGRIEKLLQGGSKLRSITFSTVDQSTRDDTATRGITVVFDAIDDIYLVSF